MSEELQGFLSAFNPATGEVKPDATPQAEPTQQTQATTETVAEQKVEEQRVEPQKPTETAVSWKDAIKGVDPKELYQELGFDDFDIEFSEYRKKGGDPYRWLEAKTRDWTKIPDTDVIRASLKDQYPDLSAEDFEVIASDYLETRFPDPKPLDELATDEEKAAYDKQKRIVDLKRKTEADQLRKKFAEADSKYSIPEKKDDTQARLLEESEKAKREFTEMMLSDEATQKLKQLKKISAGDGEEMYQTEVNPDEILGYVNDGKFFSLFSKQNEKGDPIFDFDLLYSTINYAMNRKGFEKGLIDYGKTLGIKKESDEIHNIPKTDSTKAADIKESLHDAFRKRGVGV